MKKNYILILLFLGVLLHSQSADQKYLDSLNTIINKSNNPEIKVRNMAHLSTYWMLRDTVKSFEILKKAETHAGSNRFLKGIIILNKGIVYVENKPEKAKKILEEADLYLKDINTKTGYEERSKVWSNLAKILQQKGKEKEAVDMLISKAIPLLEKSGNKQRMGTYQSFIGMSLFNMQEYEKAEQYFKTAINTVKDLNTKEKDETLFWSNLLLADIYILKNKFDEAKKYLDQCAALRKNKYESHFDTAYYRSLSEYYIQTKDNAKAMDAISKGYAIAKKIDISRDLLALNLQKFTILRSENKLQEAEKVMLEVLQNKEGLHSIDQLESLKKMAQLQSDLGNDKSAYKYQKQYITELENFNKEENKQNVQELETKYNTTIKEQKLLTLESESKQQKIIFGISTIFLLGLASVLAYAFNQRKKRNKQELLIFEQNKKLEVSEAIIEGEEHERTRIARELHDGISGQLTGIKIQLENNKDTENNEKSATQIGSVLKELRQTARNLMPESLLQSGLEQALAEYCSNMQSENTQVSFYGSNLSKITDKNKQLNIFRIVQELVTNAVRHGKATNILVQAVLENGMLLIDVEDNGKGFETTTNKRNLGMNNIENRVKSLNGKVHWESQVGQGTNANIECKL